MKFREAKFRDIGAFEAKTHLSEFIEQARQGARFYITRRGLRVAILKGIDDETPNETTASSLVDLSRRIRTQSNRRGPSLPKLVNEGRRV